MTILSVVPQKKPQFWRLWGQAQPFLLGNMALQTCCKPHLCGWPWGPGSPWGLSRPREAVGPKLSEEQAWLGLGEEAPFSLALHMPGRSSRGQPEGRTQSQISPRVTNFWKGLSFSGE